MKTRREEKALQEKMVLRGSHYRDGRVNLDSVASEVMEENTVIKIFPIRGTRRVVLAGFPMEKTQIMAPLVDWLLVMGLLEELGEITINNQVVRFRATVVLAVEVAPVLPAVAVEEDSPVEEEQEFLLGTSVTVVEVAVPTIRERIRAIQQGQTLAMEW